jgi:hypothetical protein
VIRSSPAVAKTMAAKTMTDDCGSKKNRRGASGIFAHRAEIVNLPAYSSLLRIGLGHIVVEYQDVPRAEPSDEIPSRKRSI